LPFLLEPSHLPDGFFSGTSLEDGRRIGTSSPAMAALFEVANQVPLPMDPTDLNRNEAVNRPHRSIGRRAPAGLETELIDITRAGLLTCNLT
jgi:hypothetical protein